MDFNKINAMVDELVKNFDIIEEQTKTLEAERLADNKKLFWETYKYFQNLYGLLEKVRIKEHSSFFAYTNAQHFHTITIKYGHYYANLVFDGDGFHDVPLKSPNPRWFEEDYFKRYWFKDTVIPAIKSIDFDYIEKQFVEELNERITDKAERIEAQYKKALEV